LIMIGSWASTIVDNDSVRMAISVMIDLIVLSICQADEWDTAET